MDLVLVVVRTLLAAFWFLLLVRSVVELVQSFSPDWRPRGVLVVVLELVFMVTDPPVRLFRRIIPDTTIGAVRLDISLMVLMFVVLIALRVVS
ncbi:MAG: YggT family protein [Segniliparus sp.]|uniref:YggT family protein n=1 Tax=Segniliparus sp. TaxID=2804064 RepID=UPI003F41A5DF